MSLAFHYNVYGCFRDPLADVRLAADAVDAGFEGIWIGDHFHPWIDSRPYTHHVFPWFGTLMAEVPDVPVGTSVTCPMLRYRPPLVAQACATLDAMYPDRLELGVGVGEAVNEAHFLEEWPDWTTRADMLVEAMEIMRSLWDDSGWTSYDGEYFQYDTIKLYTPPSDRIPIHWAGWGPKSCARAGRHADGLMTAAGPDLIADQVLPNFRRGREDANRDPGAGPVATEYSACVGPKADLVAQVRQRGEHVPADTELDTADPRDVQAVADERLRAMDDDEIADGLTITTDPEVIVDELTALEDAGVTRVIIGSPVGDPRRTVSCFEREIFPRFR